MALPSAAPERLLKHRRSIDVQIFACGNGLWELDALVVDTKTRDFPIAGSLRRAGDPIHEMLLRIVIDEQCNIVDAGSQTRAMPYPGSCDDLGDVYGRLIGLNLLKNFRRDVGQRLGGVAGCTHLTELTQVLPTAAVQAFAGDVFDTREDSTSDTPPFQIDRCHALRHGGPVVQEFYPRWYRPTPPAPPASNT